MTFEDCTYFVKCCSCFTYRTFYFLNVVPFFIHRGIKYKIIYIKYDITDTIEIIQIDKLK